MVRMNTIHVVAKYAKVIKMIKSPTTGAYIFKEEMVLNEDVKKFFEE